MSKWGLRGTANYNRSVREAAERRFAQMMVPSETQESPSQSTAPAAPTRGRGGANREPSPYEQAMDFMRSMAGEATQHQTEADLDEWMRSNYGAASDVGSEVDANQLFLEDQYGALAGADMSQMVPPEPQITSGSNSRANRR